MIMAIEPQVSMFGHTETEFSNRNTVIIASIQPNNIKIFVKTGYMHLVDVQ